MRRAFSSVSGTARRAAQVTAGLAALLLVACQSHSAAWDDAWAGCEANATEQMEYASPDPDQRATWRERHTAACMQAQGFSDPQYLIK